MSLQRGGRLGINAGIHNGRSKLTQEQADEIRALYAEQKGKPRVERLSQAAIGAMYGVSQFAVSMITRGDRYVAEYGRPASRPDPRTLRARLLARGGTSDLANLQTLCELHHAEKTATERSMAA